MSTELVTIGYNQVHGNEVLKLEFKMNRVEACYIYNKRYLMPCTLRLINIQVYDHALMIHDNPVQQKMYNQTKHSEVQCIKNGDTWEEYIPPILLDKRYKVGRTIRDFTEIMHRDTEQLVKEWGFPYMEVEISDIDFTPTQDIKDIWYGQMSRTDFNQFVERLCFVLDFQNDLLESGQEDCFNIYAGENLKRCFMNHNPDVIYRPIKLRPWMRMHVCDQKRTVVESQMFSFTLIMGKMRSKLMLRSQYILNLIDVYLPEYSQYAPLTNHIPDRQICNPKPYRYGITGIEVWLNVDTENYPMFKWSLHDDRTRFSGPDKMIHASIDSYNVQYTKKRQPLPRKPHGTIIIYRTHCSMSILDPTIATLIAQDVSVLAYQVKIGSDIGFYTNYLSKN